MISGPGRSVALLLAALAPAIVAPLPAPAQQPATQQTQVQPAASQPPDPERPAAQAQTPGQRADAWKFDLDNMMLALQRQGIRDEELAAHRAVAEQIIAEARALEARLQPEVAAIQARLDQLGPPPAEGDPAEAPDIAERRRSEAAALAAADAALKKVRLATVQAEQVVRDIATLRRDLFAESLSVRNRSILSPALWIEGFQDLPRVARGVRFLIGDSWAVGMSRITPRSVAMLLAAGAVAILIGIFVRRSVLRLVPAASETADVSRLQKLSRAALVMATDGVIPLIAVAALYLGLEVSGLLTPRLAELNRGLFTAVAVFSFLFGLSRGICAPLRSDWRLLPLSDTAAAQAVASATLIAGVLATSAYLETANDVLVAPVSVEVLKRAVTALLIALIVASGLWRLGGAASAAPQAGMLWRWLRGLVWLALGTIFAGLIAGYIALANFIAIQLVFAGAIFVAVWLVLGLVEELAGTVLAPTSRFAAAMSSTLGISQGGVTQLMLVLSGLVRMAVIAMGAMLILLPWGLDTGQWHGWIQKAFFGFRIGEVTISLSSILMALAVFGVVMLASRALQSWLANSFLPNTRLDLGLRNSIRTIVGYAGVVVAAIFAFTYMGFDLANVALVAGALSVGIGFGLQSIVNNFVSGLILLAERPIKEGDWIVVGAEQGNVRRISIRSTEIETFDRATVIVPNSDLVTGTVKNWMHSGTMGRVVLPISVAYGADPEQVRDILLDIARGHADVLAYPEPRVFFTDFAESALVFTLYAYVGNVNDAGSVSSDFRFEILRRFREAGIEIPIPQRDVNIRDIDRLGDAIAGRSPNPENSAE